MPVSFPSLSGWMTLGEMFDTERACCEEHFPGQECIGNVSKPPTHQPTLPPTTFKPTTRTPTIRPSNPPSRPVTNAPTKMTRYPTSQPTPKLVLESQSSSYEIVQAVSNEIAAPTMRPTTRIPATQYSTAADAFMGSQASAFANMQTNSNPIPMKGQESSSQQSQILSLQAQIQTLKSSSGELTMRQKQMLKMMRKKQMKLKQAAKRAQQKAMIARQQALAAKKAAQTRVP